jgi:hypothetical protein
MYKLETPIYGEWLYWVNTGEGIEPDFPDAVEIDGVLFTRAERKQPYAGVLEQYREAVPRNSMHLMVLDDGYWIVEHVDEYNPDMGHPVRHFIKDHPFGKLLIFTGGGLIMTGIAVKRGMTDASNKVKTP